MQKYSQFVLIILIFSMNSCKKENTVTTANKDSQMAQDNNLAESYSDDISIIADESYKYGKLQTRGDNSILADTVKITKVDSVITIDFGTNGITCKDGRVRKGKVIITFTNGFRTIGSSVSNTFDNYYIEDNKVEGNRSVTFNGQNSSGNYNWTIVSTLTITKPNGSKIFWSSNRTRTMIAGAATPFNWLDDQYSISGSANGTTSLGDNYSLIITKDLLVKVGCRYIVDGILVYTRNTSTATLNYGYGGTSSCEASVLLTYNGNDYIIYQ